MTGVCSIVYEEELGKIMSAAETAARVLAAGSTADEQLHVLCVLNLQTRAYALAQK